MRLSPLIETAVAKISKSFIFHCLVPNPLQIQYQPLNRSVPKKDKKKRRKVKFGPNQVKEFQI